MQPAYGHVLQPNPQKHWHWKRQLLDSEVELLDIVPLAVPVSVTRSESAAATARSQCAASFLVRARNGLNFKLNHLNDPLF